jgi:GTPase SAR1 family protein
MRSIRAIHNYKIKARAFIYLISPKFSAWNLFKLTTTFTMDASSSTPKKKPVAIITIGMAGAGKSTFVQRINSYLHSLDPPSPPYILNLDPAVTHVPFEANIDIRDTVNYQEVMKQCV